MCSWLANRQLTLSLWQLTGQPKPLLGDSRCHQVLVNRVSTLPDGQVSAGPPKPYIVLRNHQLHYSAQAGPGVPGSSPTSSPMQNRILGAMQILRAAQLIGAALGLLKPHLRCFSAFAAKGLRKPPAVWINQVWTQAWGGLASSSPISPRRLGHSPPFLSLLCVGAFGTRKVRHAARAAEPHGQSQLLPRPAHNRIPARSQGQQPCLSLPLRKSGAWVAQLCGLGVLAALRRLLALTPPLLLLPCPSQCPDGQEAHDQVRCSAAWVASGMRAGRRPSPGRRHLSGHPLTRSSMHGDAGTCPSLPTSTTASPPSRTRWSLPPVLWRSSRLVRPRAACKGCDVQGAQQQHYHGDPCQPRWLLLHACRRRPPD